MKSSHSFTQTMMTTSSNILRTFVYIPFVEASEMKINLLVQKTVVHNFLRIPQSTFQTLPSTFQMKSSRFCTQTMTTTSCNIVETFVYIPFIEASEIKIYLLVQKTVVHNFLPIPESTFPTLPSTVQMKSSHSSTQTIMTTSSNIVRTIVYIPFVEASGMRIELLVQKTVVHNFLRIPQSTFPTLPSTVQIKSSRSSTQTMMTTSSNIVRTFAYIPFIESSEIKIYLLLQKTVVHNFLRIPQSTFPTRPSTVQMKSSRSSTQTMMMTSSNIVRTFVYIPFIEASEMKIYLLVQKTVVHNFLRIPQSTFPTLPSTVQMKSSRSSTQTMMTTSSNIVRTFAYIPFIESSEIKIYLLLQKTVVHNFLRIPQSTFPTRPSTVQMKSSRSSTQTMMMTSSNIVRTFVYIPFIEASEMKIYLLVQKTVVHNFLRIPQSTFPTLPSTVQMKSSRSSTQTMMTTSSNIVRTFAYIPFIESSEIKIYLLLQKTVVHNFLRIPQSTFPTRPSTVQMKSSRSSTQTMMMTSSNIVRTFVYIPFIEASEMKIYLLVQKTVVHNFLRIPQSTFPTLPSTVQMKSSRFSTQTMTTTSCNIVETFVYIPFVEASEMRIDLLVQKTVVHNFLRIPQRTFPTLPSTVQMKSSRSLTQRMMTTSSNNLRTFVYIDR